MKIEKIKNLDKDFEEIFSDNKNVICVSNCYKVCPKEFKSLVVFDENWTDDIDTILGLYIGGEYFAGKKLDDNQRKEMIDLASSCLKEISPIALGDGRSLYYKYTPDNVFVSWDIDLTDKDGKVLDYYKEREECLYLKLIEFIIANKVLSKWCKNFSKDLNFPIFIKDVFDDANLKEVDTIMNLIKNLEKQVFVMLGNRKVQIENLCDKVVDIKTKSVSG